MAARLSSVSTTTLSALLERARLQQLGKTPPASQLVNIKGNLEQLKDGILQLEQSQGESNATNALRRQWERAKRMLGEDGIGIPDLPSLRPVTPPAPSLHETVSWSDPIVTSYRDDPLEPPSPRFDPADELLVQRQMMDDQDTHLETLSRSIQRQHELSENIGDELDVHNGLLEDVEAGIDRTTLRLGGTRKRLDHVARSAKDNCSALTIGTLIVVLLILIIIFHT